MNRLLFKAFSLVTILALALGGMPVQTVKAAPASLAGTYAQNFDTLASTGSSNTWINDATISGWYSTRILYIAGAGTSNAGGLYSFGATAADRALGSIASGSTSTIFYGVRFVNDTGGVVTQLDITYTGEQWRTGGSSTASPSVAQILDFQYQVGATSISSGTWSDFDALDFTSPIFGTTAPSALDGNAPANRLTLSASITGLNIQPNQEVWLRWQDINDANNDHGLAVDDLSVSAVSNPVDDAPEVSNTFPEDGATDFPVNANLTVTFSEPVNVTDPWFDLTCSVSGAGISTSFSGGPTTSTLDPGVPLVHGEECTLTIFADQVSDQDANDPPDDMEVNFIVGFSPYDVCATGFTPIYEIQGDGLSTPIPGTVTTQGVVVGDFEGSAGLQGFYMQDVTGDGDAATSDGIFVFTGSSNLVSAGQVVRVTGYARERFNQTTLNGSNSNNSAVPAANIINCGSGSVEPTEVLMPFADANFPERFEGMLVRFSQPLVISEYFNYERFGEIVLALPLDGESRPFTGTSVDEPGLDANARTLANSLRRITLDDGLGTQNPVSVRHPNGDPFSLLNRFRGGDRVTDAVGVLGYDFGLYRIQPTEPAEYESVNPRTNAPEDVNGSLKVAAMNTLNFFLTPDNIQEASNAPDDPADNLCGPVPSLECRGWDGNQPLEFSRQRDKLLAALVGLDADVVGLNELENTIGVDPLGDPVNGVVAGLNAMLGPGTYAYIDTGVIGTDAIRVGLIYKPGKVTPVGDFKILDSSVDPRFVDTRSRPALAQTFEDLSTGARFTVVVNHFKSKGDSGLASTTPPVGICVDGDPDNDTLDCDQGDGQGYWNYTRTQAAEALVDWLATDPTGSGDADVIIIGDLNSYAMENPIDAILAGGYTNLIREYQGEYAYSYVFDGQFGYLDHALSNPSLTPQVTGAADWHINADEPDLLDYDTSFKPPAQEAIYEPNAYRSSDHDPVIVGLDLLHYDFSGFFPPIDNLPVLNAAKAGSAIPVKFSLGGDQGLDIFLAGYPVSRKIACDTNSPLDDIEQTVTAGGSGLSYNASSDRYTYVWKTNKAWAGTCRQLVVILKDGSIHLANFKFK